jgi:hypothetical protein
MQRVRRMLRIGSRTIGIIRVATREGGKEGRWQGFVDDHGSLNAESE